jgi:PST family polysaccharide transporter
MAITLPASSTACVWLATAWVPGAPHRDGELGAMIRFGSIATLNALVIYVAYNLDKVLLGRFWGPAVLGIYGRAYQLVNLPMDGITSAVGGVAFSALSRLHDDPERLKSYFLKGYSLVLTITLPVAVLCALLADDIVWVFLGPKWADAALIFRLLTPTILIFAMINPTGWLLYSTGRAGRSLKISLAIAPLVMAGYILGLPYGASGVALGYSAAMTLWLVPHIVWSLRGTTISVRHVVQAASHPLVSALVAALATVAAQHAMGEWSSALARLTLGTTVFLVSYLWMLLYVMGQKPLYLGLLRGLRGGLPS